MKRDVTRSYRWGGLLLLCLVVAVAAAHAATTAATSPSAVQRGLERLKIAVAPLGWDTKYTWLQSRSGQLDKRPALEYLIGIDRQTGGCTPELAKKWEMSPDAKSWTLVLRKGVKFHEHWGEFTAKDVCHSIFLITQPESVQTDAGIWRSLMGIGKADSAEDVAKKVEQQVQIVDDHQVVIRTQFAAPELIDTLSAKTDLAMESKARWDAGAMAGGRWFDEGPQSHSRVSSGEEICSILEDWKL